MSVDIGYSLSDKFFFEILFCFKKSLFNIFLDPHMMMYHNKQTPHRAKMGIIWIESFIFTHSRLCRQLNPSSLFEFPDMHSLVACSIDSRATLVLEFEVWVSRVKICQCIIICWSAGPMGQSTCRPSVWCSKYYSFFIKSCKVLCKNSFNLCLYIFLKKIQKWK